MDNLKAYISPVLRTMVKFFEDLKAIQSDLYFQESPSEVDLISFVIRTLGLFLRDIRVLLCLLL